MASFPKRADKRGHDLRYNETPRLALLSTGSSAVPNELLGLRSLCPRRVGVWVVVIANQRRNRKQEEQHRDTGDDSAQAKPRRRKGESHGMRPGGKSDSAKDHIGRDQRLLTPIHEDLPTGGVKVGEH